MDNQLREDLLVTALEGGSNYWYTLDAPAIVKVKKYGEGTTPISTRMWLAIKAGETIKINDTEDEEEVLGEINLKSIQEGEKLMKQDYPDDYEDALTDLFDANTADVWFQLAVLGDVDFG